MASDSNQSLKQTALHGSHLSLGAAMVPFGGWEMPIRYSGILAEAKAVRDRSGIFDISHMGRLRFSGATAENLLQNLLTSDLRRMKVGQATYCMILNENGGIIDDTILYFLSKENRLLICNAANRDEVIGWILKWASQEESNSLLDETEATAMIAVQGPESSTLLDKICRPKPSTLKPFYSCSGQLEGREILISRTGYTGDKGFELIIQNKDAPFIWAILLEAGTTPCGLGARDILRLEAGLMLHGIDMDSNTTPLEAGLERFVKWDKGDFIGSSALKSQKKTGVTKTMTGLTMLERGIPRHGNQIFYDNKPIGQVTSGTHSPFLDKDIGLGYVSIDHLVVGTKVSVHTNNKVLAAELTKLPFYTKKAIVG